MNKIFNKLMYVVAVFLTVILLFPAEVEVQVRLAELAEPVPWNLASLMPPPMIIRLFT